MNRFKKQNEYYRKSKQLREMNWGAETKEIGEQNRKLQDEFFKRCQFFKKVNKAIDNRK